MVVQVAFIGLHTLAYRVLPGPAVPGSPVSVHWLVMDPGRSGCSLLAGQLPLAPWHRRLPGAASGIAPWCKVCHNLLCRLATCMAVLTFGSEKKQDLVYFSLTLAALARPGGDCLYRLLFHLTTAVTLILLLSCFVAAYEPQAS